MIFMKLFLAFFAPWDQTVINNHWRFYKFSLSLIPEVSKMNSEAIRTQGDGNESPDITPEATHKSIAQAVQKAEDNNNKLDKLGRQYLSKQFQSTSSILYNPTNTTDQTFNYPPPVEPKGKRFYLIPKLVHTTTAKPLSLRNKKLNLVLMEPYRVSFRLVIDNKRHPLIAKFSF